MAPGEVAASAREAAECEGFVSSVRASRGIGSGAGTEEWSAEHEQLLASHPAPPLAQHAHVPLAPQQSF